MTRYDSLESTYIELTPGNGHVFIYKGDKIDLLTAKVVPASGESLIGFFSAAADSDTPVDTLQVDLADIGVQNGKAVYIGSIEGAVMTAALSETEWPDGREIFEIVKGGTRVREVTRMIVRRFRES